MAATAAAERDPCKRMCAPSSACRLLEPYARARERAHHGTRVHASAFKDY